MTNCPPSVAAPWYIAGAPLFSAVATVILGAIAASIAYQQWRTAHDKFRLDLLDRRYKVFDACVQALEASYVGDDRDGYDEAWNRLSAVLITAQLLFPRKVVTMIHRLAAVARTRRERDMPEYARLRESENPLEFINHRNAWTLWCAQAKEELVLVFAPYIGFKA